MHQVGEGRRGMDEREFLGKGEENEMLGFYYSQASLGRREGGWIRVWLGRMRGKDDRGDSLKRREVEKNGGRPKGEWWWQGLSRNEGAEEERLMGEEAQH
jgi:hypothetical protein